MWQTYYEYFRYNCQWNGIRIAVLTSIDLVAMHHSKLFFHVTENACSVTMDAIQHRCPNAVLLQCHNSGWPLVIVSAKSIRVCVFFVDGCLDCLKVMQFNFGVVQCALLDLFMFRNSICKLDLVNLLSVWPLVQRQWQWHFNLNDIWIQGNPLRKLYNWIECAGIRHARVYSYIESNPCTVWKHVYGRLITVKYISGIMAVRLWLFTGFIFSLFCYFCFCFCICIWWPVFFPHAMAVFPLFFGRWATMQFISCFCRAM